MNPGKSLKQRTLNAYVWDMAGMFLKRGVTFVISIFLARLLDPSEFGLVGMAMVFVSIAQVLIDVGFSSAIIQKQDTPPGAYDTIFFINLGIGFTLAGVFFFSAPLIADFYSQPEVANLVRWFSLFCIINSFNQVQSSLLKKSLNFKALTTRMVVGNATGGVVGVVMAFQGFGVYSLVAQQLISSIVSAATLWRVSAWRPRFYFNFSDVKGMLSYSTFILLDRLLSEITRKLDVLVVGRAFSAATLGYYTRSTSLNDLVGQYTSSSLTKVLFPMFSSLQNERDTYVRVYFKVFSVIVLTSYFLTGMLFILGEDVILLLFGNKWLPSVAIFKVLILAAGNLPMSSLMVNAFITQGYSRQNFQVGIIRKTIRVSALSTAIFGDLPLFIGSIVFASYLNTAVNLVALRHYVGLPVMPHLRLLGPGLLSLILIVSADLHIGFDDTYSRLLLASSFVVLYGGYHFIAKTQGYSALIGLIGKFKQRKKR